MSHSRQSKSKRTIIQWALGILIALPTFFPEHMAASSLFAFPVLLILPGMLIAMALSGNVHAYPPLLATAVNAVFYFLIIRLIWWIIDRFKRRRATA